jgi:hypothetical protein
MMIPASNPARAIFPQPIETIVIRNLWLRIVPCG